MTIKGLHIPIMLPKGAKKGQTDYYEQVTFAQPALDQGWKLHISATPDNYHSVFATATAYLLDEQVTFKYPRPQFVGEVFGENEQPRAIGKLLTAYPEPTDFERVSEELAKRLSHFQGIPIVGDQAVLDSQTVYKRYGAIDRQDDLIVDINGDLRQDQWQKSSQSHNREDLLFHGRYRFEKGLQASVSGNVYLMLDTLTSQKIVLKEAKKYMLGTLKSAQHSLETEAGMLVYLADKLKVPRLLDSFWQEGHYFVVESYIEGSPLHEHEDVQSLFQQLYQYIKICHRFGVIINDISDRNFLLEKGRVCCVDFGSAYFDGTQTNRTKGATVGFFDQQVLTLDAKASDYHKLGYLMMCLCFPFNRYLASDASGKKVKSLFRQWAQDQQLDSLLVEVIFCLIDQPLGWQDQVERLLGANLSNLKSEDHWQTRDPYEALIVDLATHQDNKKSWLGIRGRCSEMVVLRGKQLSDYLDQHQVMLKKLIVSSRDKSLATGYLGLGLVLLYTKRHHPYDQDLDDLVKLVNERVISEGRLLASMDHQHNRSAQGAYLIYCAKYDRYFGDERLKKIGMKLAENAKKYAFKDEKGELHYVTNYVKRLSSPYLYEGTCGYLEAVLDLATGQASKSLWHTMLAPFLQGLLATNGYCQRVGLFNGTLGLVYSLARLYKHYPDEIDGQLIAKFLARVEDYVYLAQDGQQALMTQTIGGDGFGIFEGIKGLGFVKAFIESVKL